MWKKWAIILFFSLVLSPAHGDKVILKNGSAIKGRILEQTENRLSIRTPSGTFSLMLKDIKSVHKDSPYENHLLDARLKLAQKEIGSALASYLEALELGLPFPRFTEHFLKYQESMNEAFSDASDYKKDRCGEILLKLSENFSGDLSLDKATTDTLEFLYVSAGFLAQTAQKQKAMDIYASLPLPFYRAFPLKRASTINFLKKETQRQTSLGNFDQAMETLEKLQNLDTTAGRTSKTLVYLRWAARLREQEQYSEAALIYSNKIAPLSREIAENRLNHLFDIMGNKAISTNEILEVSSLVKKHARILKPEQKNQRLARLFRSLGELLLEDENTTDALKYFREGFISSNRKDMTLLALYDYSKTLARLSPPRYLEHFQLGIFCREKGLKKFAIQHFHSASKEPRLKSSAQKQLLLIKTGEQIETLKQSLELYDNSEYTKALDMLQPLLSDAATSDVLGEASRLDQLCRGQLVLESNKRPLKALIAYQQAERHFLLEDYDQALVKLELILEAFPDTPIAPKARNLLILALRKSDLARLEKPGASYPDKTKGRKAFPKPGRLQSQINTLLDSLNNE